MSTAADPLTTFGQRLRWAREQHCLSQRQLAESLGVSQPLISSWEGVASSPRIGTVERLADALFVPAAWLAFGGALPVVGAHSLSHVG